MEKNLLVAANNTEEMETTIIRPAYKMADAIMAECRACRVPITGNQFWGWQKSLWLHTTNGNCPNRLPSGRIRIVTTKNHWKYQESTGIRLYRAADA